MILSGGGTACGKLLFWDWMSGKVKGCINTGAQLTGAFWVTPQTVAITTGNNGGNVQL